MPARAMLGTRSTGNERIVRAGVSRDARRLNATTLRERAFSTVVPAPAGRARSRTHCLPAIAPRSRTRYHAVVDGLGGSADAPNLVPVSHLLPAARGDLLCEHDVFVARRRLRRELRAQSRFPGCEQATRARLSPSTAGRHVDWSRHRRGRGDDATSRPACRSSRFVTPVTGCDVGSGIRLVRNRQAPSSATTCPPGTYSDLDASCSRSGRTTIFGNLARSSP